MLTAELGSSGRLGARWVVRYALWRQLNMATLQLGYCAMASLGSIGGGAPLVARELLRTRGISRCRQTDGWWLG